MCLNAVIDQITVLKTLCNISCIWIVLVQLYCTVNHALAICTILVLQIIKVIRFPASSSLFKNVFSKYCGIHAEIDHYPRNTFYWYWKKQGKARTGLLGDECNSALRIENEIAINWPSVTPVGSYTRTERSIVANFHTQAERLLVCLRKLSAYRRPILPFTPALDSGAFSQNQRYTVSQNVFPRWSTPATGSCKAGTHTRTRISFALRFFTYYLFIFLCFVAYLVGLLFCLQRVLVMFTEKLVRRDSFHSSLI